ncbi:putative F-box/kelch-repeat protein At5g24040 [Aegilops tauschii subsp. strangulata]|uniref:putative F-box/kelch-repeat protein At5g24040 n=1 Tax=Aegilops tauschii subsp. strangulata TaxID=200361 RepID=UPI00098AC71F|nr:uncharacterized protein LOC109762859 [Aegilops tauschii subsp. strangulata]
MPAAPIPIAVAGSSSCAPPPQEAGSPWPDLPPELLRLVVLRVPSHADCVRLRAVCRPWRSAASDLPPLLPWLALRDGTFLSLPGGVVHLLPAIPANVARRVSTGGMLFLLHDDGGCSLMNPLTGETTPQHVDHDILWFQVTRLNPLYLIPYNIRKIVVSDNMFVVSSCNYSRLHIFTRGPRPQVGSIKLSPLIPDGMALFKGKLYLLTGCLTSPDAHRELHVLDLRSGLQHQPSVQCCIPGTTTDCFSDGVYKRYYYLVVSGDRLLMVEREIEVDRVSNKRIRTRWLKVFEAMDLDLDCGHGRWRKVDRLKGRALFLSLECSFSLPASVDGCAVGVGAQEDCVYFVRELKLSTHPTCLTKAEGDHLCCGVYKIIDQTVAPLPTEMLAKTAVSHAGPWSLTWFPLPPN